MQSPRNHWGMKTALIRSQLSQNYTAKIDTRNSGNVRVTHWAQRPKLRSKVKPPFLKIQ